MNKILMIAFSIILLSSCNKQSDPIDIITTTETQTTTTTTIVTTETPTTTTTEATTTTTTAATTEATTTAVVTEAPTTTTTTVTTQTPTTTTTTVTTQTPTTTTTTVTTQTPTTTTTKETAKKTSTNVSSEPPKTVTKEVTIMETEEIITKSDRRIIEEYYNITKDNISETSSEFLGEIIEGANDLTVRIVEEYFDSEHKQKIYDILGHKDVKFEPCKYSQNYLNKIGESLKSKAIGYVGVNNKSIKDLENISNYPAIANVTSISSYSMSNRVEVGLLVCNDEQIARFKKEVIDDDCINFYQGGYATLDGAESEKTEDSTINPTATVNLNPGAHILGTKQGSIGYRAKFITTQINLTGVVTASHITRTSLGSVKYYPATGAAIQFVSVAQTTLGGKIDASFSVLDNVGAVEVTNNLDSGQLSLTIADIGIGNTVTRQGYGSPTSSGVVTDDSVLGIFDLDDGIFWVNDLAKANYTSAPMDSGGCVYKTIGTVKQTAGIHTGRDGGQAVFTKASNITIELGVTRY